MQSAHVFRVFHFIFHLFFIQLQIQIEKYLLQNMIYSDEEIYIIKSIFRWSIF